MKSEAGPAIFTTLPEIVACSKHIASLLYPALTSGSPLEEKFISSLNKILSEKFTGHWYAETPFRGSAYRCLIFTPVEMDGSVRLALESAGVDDALVKQSPLSSQDLRVWVDPGDVSFKVGKTTYTQQIYGTRENHIRAESPISTQSPSHKRTTSLSPPPPNRRSVSPNSKLSPKAMSFIPSPVMDRRGIPSLSPVLTRSRNERSPVNSPILTQRGRPTKRHFPTNRYTLPILVA